MLTLLCSLSHLSSSHLRPQWRPHHNDTSATLIYTYRHRKIYQEVEISDRNCELVRMTSGRRYINAADFNFIAQNTAFLRQRLTTFDSYTSSENVRILRSSRAVCSRLVWMSPYVWKVRVPSYDITLLSAQHGHLYSTQPTASLSRVLGKEMLPDTGETLCLASVRQRHVVDPAHESLRDSLPISRCWMNGMIFPLWGFRCSIALPTPPRWGNRSRHISSISQLLTNTPRFNQQTWLIWMLDTHGHVRCPRTGNIILAKVISYPTRSFSLVLLIQLCITWLTSQQCYDCHSR